MQPARPGPRYSKVIVSLFGSYSKCLELRGFFGCNFVFSISMVLSMVCCCYRLHGVLEKLRSVAVGKFRLHGVPEKLRAVAKFQ